MESWEVRIFLWGGGVPPHTSDLDRGSRGVSPSLPLSSSASSVSSAVSSGAANSYPSMAGWTALGWLAALWVGGGLSSVALSFPSFPCPLSLLFGFVCPVPWPLGLVGPVVVVLGLGHYVGRPPAGS